MHWFFLFLALAFVTHFCLCFRLGGSSVALAILLPLSLPADAVEGDLTPAAVASASGKL